MSEWFATYGHGLVHDRLYVGAVPLDAQDAEFVALELRCDRVVSLVEDHEYAQHGADRDRVVAVYQQAGVEEWRSPTRDFGGLDPDLIDQAARHVVELLDAGRTVYLHCRAGWQRSATVAAAVLCLSENTSPGTALRLLRARKPTCQPLEHQVACLHAWHRAHGS